MRRSDRSELQGARQDQDANLAGVLSPVEIHIKHADMIDSERGLVALRPETEPEQDEPGADGSQSAAESLDSRGVGTLLARLTVAAAWILGVTGWVVAAAFILYSHGESDRVRNTRHDAATQVAQMAVEVNSTLTLQHFLAMFRDARALEMMPARGVAAGAMATFLFANGGSSGAIVVSGLAAQSSGRVYAVWVRRTRRDWRLVGWVAPATDKAEASAVITAPQPFDQYVSVSLDIESRLNVSTPTSSMLFTAQLPDLSEPCKPTAQQIAGC